MVVAVVEETQKHHSRTAMMVDMIRKKLVTEEADNREDEEKVRINETYNVSLVVNTDTIPLSVGTMNHPRKAKVKKQRI